jgi:uncharacterized membrane protein YraQ (UPF0718 family)
LEVEVSILEWIVTMLQSGADSLASYLAAHVLLCLVPAFFIAGAMTALIPKEAITHYLGRDASKWVSYPMAALGGFVLAVCSCTILPLFAGIYRQGAGLGPDTWVRVEGRFEVGEFDGEAMPILVAEAITPTEPPNQPYVYP